MIKEIISDQFILSQVSSHATIEDQQVGIDLLDTLKANEYRCVGMAANMIGVLKNIIVVKDAQDIILMYNPQIIKTSGALYSCDEGCLSHQGTKPTQRYEKIKVKYQDKNFKVKIKTFSSLTAQIIQHEIDHCQGILI